MTSAQLEPFQGVLNLLGERATAASQVTPLRYIESPSSHVLEVRLDSGEGAQTAFIKTYKVSADKPDEKQKVRTLVTDEFEMLRNTASLFSGSSCYAVVDPIACFPEHYTLITAAADGWPLSALLRRPFPWRLSTHQVEWLTSIFERIGGWVQAFQGPGVPDRRVSLTEMYAYVDVRVSVLVERGRLSSAERDQLLRRFEELAAQVPECELGVVRAHADFCPSNVHASDTKITVLDPVPGRTDCRYHDLAHMCVHLENLKARPWVGVALVERLQTAMLQSFDRDASPNSTLFQLAFMKNVLARMVQDETQPSSTAQRLLCRYIRRHNVARLKAIGMHGADSTTQADSKGLHVAS